MRIHLLGGVDAPGASCLVVDVGGQRILIDAGVSTAVDPEDLLARIHALGGIHAAVVTHAHADHAGALPAVLAAYPHVSLLATAATLALLDLFYVDARPIFAQHATRREVAPRDRRGQTATLVGRRVPLAFGQRHCLLSESVAGASGCWVTLYRAGHLLGAAMVLLETPDGTILISGDVCRAPLRTVQRALPPRRRIDTLILESTFGHQSYHPPEAMEARLIARVQQTLAGGGHVLIASAALGPAQELLLILAAARAHGHLAAEIWIDGSVREACQVYATHAPREHTALARFIGIYGSPFLPTGGLIQAVRDRADQQRLLTGPPSVIVSTSPTLQRGPSALYARHFARQAGHLILVPAPDVRVVPLQQLSARCAIEEYSLRLHATRYELAKLAAQIGAQQNILVHGTRPAREQLAAALAARGLTCIIPEDSGPSLELPLPSAPVPSDAPE